MKHRAIKKEFWREIRKSFPRFISIMAIVALGVAFFAGIRATKPDMELSADQMYDDRNFMDMEIISTMGLEQADVEAIKGQEAVLEAEGAYSKDVLLRTGEKQLVMKMMSLPEQINRISLKEGRMPENDQECLADTAFFEKSGYRIGDQIKVEAGGEDVLGDFLKGGSYTVVGSCTSPYYLSMSRGNSVIGNGKIDNFIIVPKTAFSMDVFTKTYLTLKDKKAQLCYSDTYKDEMKAYKEWLEKEVAPVREKARYESVMSEAAEKLDDARQELADGKAEADEKLADARKKLDDAKEKIEDGEKEVKENEKKLKDGKKEISDGEEKLAEAKDTLASSKRDLSNAEKELEDGEEKLAAGEGAYQKNAKALKEGRRQLKEAKEQLNTTGATLEAAEEELAKAREGIALQEAAGILSPEEALAMGEQLAEKQKGLDAGRAQLEAGQKSYGEKAEELAQGEAGLKAARTELDASQKEIKSARAELEAGKRKLADGQQELLEKERDLKQAKQDIKDGQKELKEGKKKIEDARAEYGDGETEYSDAKAEADEKIADGEKKIADAEEEIADIEPAEWFLLTREQNQTYVEFGQDAERIGAVGEIFPIIFFLVAALVSLTTMTRMVEEQRIQIGTLKALGYNKTTIAMKYIKYAFLATLGGSVLGGISGCIILPRVIITAYQIMYQNLEVMVTPFNRKYVLMASVIAILCVLLATAAACFKELSAGPAQLMRPEAPKQGKRVLLERVTFIWKHLNFTKKATVRNLFRYKKRFFMTIIGIGGCMALLLVGYGVKDSIFSIIDLQYNEVQIYDITTELKEDLGPAEKARLEGLLNKTDGITGYKYQSRSAVTAGLGDKEMADVYLNVLDDKENLEQFMRFLNRTNSKAEYHLSDKGVIITEKMAKTIGAKVGDTIFIRDEDTRENVEMKVEAIAENYVYHYIYMTSTLYKALYGEEPEYNELMLNHGLKTQEEEALAEQLLSIPAITSVTRSDTMKDWFSDMIGSLDIVIVVLIVSAGGLAFVVLYNLNNISINERRRELATIKVLGFYDLEVSEYIYRENIVLTILGMIVGVFLGIVLHHYVIVTCEINTLMFGRTIHPLSYLYSMLLTCLFSLIINISMHFKLKKVDMAASLKSVE